MMSRLAEARNALVRRWGEMGGYWGVGRTMAEIHALLFVTRSPLCTDQVMDQLKISRGNASMSLRALVDWGLVRLVHQPGDRKKYFTADTDVWHMFETIMRERRRREVEPIIATIDRCCETVAGTAAEREAADPRDVQEFRRRLEDLRRFLTTLGTLFELVLLYGREGLDTIAALMRSTAPAGNGDAAGAARDGAPREERRGGARRAAVWPAAARGSRRARRG